LHYLQAFAQYYDKTLRLISDQPFDLEDSFKGGLPPQILAAFQNQIEAAKRSGLWPPAQT
jgi:hypothetical protein